MGFYGPVLLLLYASCTCCEVRRCLLGHQHTTAGTNSRYQQQQQAAEPADASSSKQKQQKQQLGLAEVSIEKLIVLVLFLRLRPSEPPLGRKPSSAVPSPGLLLVCTRVMADDDDESKRMLLFILLVIGCHRSLSSLAKCVQTLY